MTDCFKGIVMLAVTIKATVDFNTVKPNFERFGVDGAFISRLVIL